MAACCKDEVVGECGRPAGTPADPSRAVLQPGAAGAPAEDDCLVRLCHIGGEWRYLTGEGAVDSALRALHTTLPQSADESTAKRMTKYMKSTVLYFGVKTPQLRIIFLSFHAAHLAHLPHQIQIYAAYRMLEGEYMEEKQVGIMTLVKNGKHLTASHLVDFAALIDTHIHEWATCDSLASKVLNMMIKRDESMAPLIAAWKDATGCSLWRLRACCVAFVKIARFARHNDRILSICRACLSSEHQSERFVQLGVGWVLRELSIADLETVVSFIKANYARFCREGLRYAIEKMGEDRRKELLEFQKPAPRHSRSATGATPPPQSPASSMAAMSPAMRAPSPALPGSGVQSQLRRSVSPQAQQVGLQQQQQQQPPPQPGMAAMQQAAMMQPQAILQPPISLMPQQMVSPGQALPTPSRSPSPVQQQAYSALGVMPQQGQLGGGQRAAQAQVMSVLQHARPHPSPRSGPYQQLVRQIANGQHNTGAAALPPMPPGQGQRFSSQAAAAVAAVLAPQQQSPHQQPPVVLMGVPSASPGPRD